MNVCRRFWEDDGLCGSYSNTRPPITPGLATHSRSAHFGLVAVSLRVQQTAADSHPDP